MAGRIRVLGVIAAGVAAVALWPIAASALAPASRIAAAMPGGMSLIEQVNGVRTAPRRAHRTWHRRGGACWYDCHWHGPIKHCSNSCR